MVYQLNINNNNSPKSNSKVTELQLEGVLLAESNSIENIALIQYYQRRRNMADTAYERFLKDPDKEEAVEVDIKDCPYEAYY